MAGRKTSEASKKLGLKIKNILKSKAISQTQAAKTLKINSQAVFNNYINGRSEIPISVLVGLMENFDISPLELFDKELNPASVPAKLKLDLLRQFFLKHLQDNEYDLKENQL